MPETHEKAGTSILIEKLQQAGCFPHPVTQIQLIETHISWVLLTGDYAYKIKKPLNLGFLDFSTLALRQRCCDEELRLNRRFAPQIYLEVVPITGDTESPQVSGDAAAIDSSLDQIQAQRWPEIRRAQALQQQEARQAQLLRRTPLLRRGLVQLAPWLGERIGHSWRQRQIPLRQGLAPVQLTV